MLHIGKKRADIVVIRNDRVLRIPFFKFEVVEKFTDPIFIISCHTGDKDYKLHKKIATPWSGAANYYALKITVSYFSIFPLTIF